MRTRTVILAILAVLSAGCHTAEITYQRHLLDFEKAEPGIILVSIPDRIVVSRLYSTGAEVNIESREIPAPLSGHELSAARKIASTLAEFEPNLRIVESGSAKLFVSDMARDPRGPGVNGYKLARAWEKSPGVSKKAWTPGDDRKTADESLDDALFDKLIVISRGPFNNNGRTLFRLIDSQTLMENYDAGYLLLVEITDIDSRINSDRLELSLVIYTRLLSLSDGLLIFENRDTVSCNEPGAVTSPALLFVPDLAALSADGFKLPGEALELIGERYGFVLAQILGFITPERLEQEKKTWTDASLEALAEMKKNIILQ